MSNKLLGTRDYSQTIKTIMNSFQKSFLYASKLRLSSGNSEFQTSSL